jgi:hypothetical protein
VNHRNPSLFIAAIVLLGLSLATRGDSAVVPRQISIDRLPPVMLWAWERPEDLRFLDPNKAGVAYLAGTLTLRGDTVDFYPRQQPLRVPPGTKLVAVVRLEISSREIPALSEEQMQEAAERIVQAATATRVEAVQVDFDAKSSERLFYRELLWELRGRLPENLGFSITALASWCMGDRWIAPLPVDEAVPMLFDMGVDHERITTHLTSGGDFRSALCRRSAGLATYDHPIQFPANRRLYLFHSRPWTEKVLAKVLSEVK